VIRVTSISQILRLRPAELTVDDIVRQVADHSAKKAAALNTRQVAAGTARSTNRKTAAATTGRKRADQIADTTSRSAGAWIREAKGVERRRRAAAQHLAELTDTQPLRWTGEISAEEWEQFLTAGADALLALGGKGKEYFWLNLVDSAEVYAAEAAALADDTDEFRPVRELAELPVDQEPDLTDGYRSEKDKKTIAAWSPFSKTRCAAARYVIRCKDGSRRFGNGDSAKPVKEVA